MTTSLYVKEAERLYSTHECFRMAEQARTAKNTHLLTKKSLAAILFKHRMEHVPDDLLDALLLSSNAGNKDGRYKWMSVPTWKNLDIALTASETSGSLAAVKFISSQSFYSYDDSYTGKRGHYSKMKILLAALAALARSKDIENLIPQHIDYLDNTRAGYGTLSGAKSHTIDALVGLLDKPDIFGKHGIPMLVELGYDDACEFVDAFFHFSYQKYGMTKQATADRLLDFHRTNRERFLWMIGMMNILMNSNGTLLLKGGISNDFIDRYGDYPLEFVKEVLSSEVQLDYDSYAERYEKMSKDFRSEDGERDFWSLYETLDPSHLTPNLAPMMESSLELLENLPQKMKELGNSSLRSNGIWESLSESRKKFYSMTELKKVKLLHRILSKGEDAAYRLFLLSHLRNYTVVEGTKGDLSLDNGLKEHGFLLSRGRDLDGFDGFLKYVLKSQRIDASTFEDHAVVIPNKEALLASISSLNALPSTWKKMEELSKKEKRSPKDIVASLLS